MITIFFLLLILQKERKSIKKFKTSTDFLKNLYCKTHSSVVEIHLWIMKRNTRNLPQIWNDLALITLHKQHYEDKKKIVAVSNRVQLTTGGVLDRPVRIQQKYLGSNRAHWQSKSRVNRRVEVKIIYQKVWSSYKKADYLPYISRSSILVFSPWDYYWLFKTHNFELFSAQLNIIHASGEAYIPSLIAVMLYEVLDF